MPSIFRLAAVATFAVAICAGNAVAHEAAFVPEAGFRVAGPVMMTPSERWNAVVTRMAAEAPPATGPCKPTTSGCALAAWEGRLTKLQAQSVETQLAAVNKSINALPYRPDAANWGQADYWETPREMFDRGGDCEGFALTKYHALRRLGFADEALSLAVVWDAVDREQHAVLLVRTGDRVRVLDNKRGKMMDWQALSDRYQTLYVLAGGQVSLSGLVTADLTPTSRPIANRTRIINGGRTLVINVRPRRNRTAVAMALPVETATVVEPAEVSATTSA
tara:strand:+ start:117 stop:947 length:831 start_codon:yes stop_codon:yes gene_type:complete